MKKKLVGLVLFAFSFFIGMNCFYAEEKTLKFSSDEYLYKIVDISEESINIYLDTNYHILDNDKIYYKIDNGEYVLSDSVSFLEIETSKLKDKSEHTITIYGVPNGNESKKTTEMSTDILCISKKQNVSNDNYGLNLNLEKFPLNTKMEVKEITDTQIINKLNLNNPNVLMVRFSSYGKDLGYYEEKYGSFTYGFNKINGTINTTWTNKANVSCKNKDCINNINVYGISGQYEILSTHHDGDEIDNIYNLDYYIYSSDIFINGYLAISDGKSIMNIDSDNKINNTNEIKNPKTMDKNILLIAGLSVAMLLGVSLSIKKLKKLYK